MSGIEAQRPARHTQRIDGLFGLIWGGACCSRIDKLKLRGSAIEPHRQTWRTNMKKLLIAAVAASLVGIAPAIAEPTKAAPLQAEQMDQVTAGTSNTISIRNRLNSRVSLKFENNVNLTGSDFKAAASADAFSSIPAFTSAVAVSKGNTVIDPSYKEWSSTAVSESAGAIDPLPVRRHR
jgi:hypothetical protein